MDAQVKRCNPALLVEGDGNFNKNIELDLNLAHEKCPASAVSIMGVQSTEAQVKRCNPVMLVDGDGNFNKNIEQDLNLAHEKCPTSAVSIMGVQSTDAQVKRCIPALLVDGDGNFNKNIELDLNLAHEKCPVSAVSIMGVQSSGKSTLMNKCFFTDFKEMDESLGMSQTTKGIWIAKCPSPNGGHKILVIDTEGSDGAERGQEDNDTFEKKTAIFALATSKTVIFNMKCDSVNLHHGASRPLLETVFRVMLRKFSTPRQVNLVFVLRDKNRCPSDTLRSQLIEGLRKVWQGMSEPQDNMNAALEDYFKIEVMAMSHYVLQREEFDKEVDNLRDRIFSLVQHGEPDRASGFIALAEKNWKEIMEDKILNLNLNRITVDRVFCHEIAEKKIQNFREDKSWLEMEGDVESGKIVQGFGKDVSSIIDKYLSQYDKESVGADEKEIDEHRKQLTEKLLEVVEKTHLSLLENMRNATLGNFQKEIIDNIKEGRKLKGIDPNKFITEFTDLREDAHVQQANWNHTGKQLEKLRSELASYEEVARSIIKTLKKLTNYKALVWTGPATPGAEVTAFSALLDLSIALPEAAAGVSTPPLAFITTIIAEYIEYKQTKQKIKEECPQNPAVDHLCKQVGPKNSD